jgi:DHA2 family multidrug resistance protein
LLAALVRREAYVMAYSDCFYLLGALLLAMVLLVWLCQASKANGFQH